MKFILLIGLVLLLVPLSSAQDNIAGIINTYTKVNSISNSCSCPTTSCSTIDVASSAGFSVNDRIIIMQMKGASVDTTNTDDHGSVLSVQDAGNYEYATISAIAANTITTLYPLKETYFTGITPTDSACVQMIRVPVYAGDVTVTGELTAQAWDGTTGGVLAFEAAGTVTLNDNITVDGLGFRKARRQSFSVSCGDDTAFYYQSTSWNYKSCTSCGYLYDDAPERVVTEASYGGCGNPCFSNRMSTMDPRLGAYRGEGIAANLFSKTFANGNVALFEKGKGKWANGGGGGGNHNAGGGGGGNVGTGGFGGNSYFNSGCPNGTSRRGRGGGALTPTSSKIFMGGGGGEGHDNGGNGNTGTNGGGIIMITALALQNSAAFTISADGIDNLAVGSGDASGGGGAGGSILLDIPTFNNAVAISAKGGKGGDHSNGNCHGTGGGGGGGLIWFESSCTPSNVTTNVSGGINGKQTAAAPDCADADYGATPGNNGTVMCGISGMTFFNENSCVLPVAFLTFSGTVNKRKVSLFWSTAYEENAHSFVIERSRSAKDFMPVGIIAAKGNSTTPTSYDFSEYIVSELQNPIFYYRIKQVDMDGALQYSYIISLSPDLNPTIALFPNPIEAGQSIFLNMKAIASGEGFVSFINLSGKTYEGEPVMLNAGMNQIEITSAAKLSPGTYFIRVVTKEAVEVQTVYIY